MIKLFYGENRVGAQEEIKRFLWDDYEVIEGEDLTKNDLPSLMMGNSLFGEERAILVRDVLSNKGLGDDLLKYLASPHKVVIWESKLDKRSSVYKALKDKVEVKEFAMPRDPNQGMVFDIYRVAK